MKYVQTMVSWESVLSLNTAVMYQFMYFQNAAMWGLLLEWCFFCSVKYFTSRYCSFVFISMRIWPLKKYSTYGVCLETIPCFPDPCWVKPSIHRPSKVPDTLIKNHTTASSSMAASLLRVSHPDLAL